MPKLDRSKIECMQCFDRMKRDPSKYFEQFDKLLPNNLTANDTVCLYKIDNIGCIMKIIERNPNAQYTVFGNKCINDMLRSFGVKSIVKYADSTTKLKDKHSFDYSAYTYTCFERSPESTQPVDFLKIGLKKGDRISLISRDGKTEYAYAFVYDGRHLAGSNGKNMSLVEMFLRYEKQHPEQLVMNRRPQSKHRNELDKIVFLKHGASSVGTSNVQKTYPAFAMVNNSDVSVKELYERYLLSRCVTKN